MAAAELELNMDLHGQPPYQGSGNPSRTDPVAPGRPLCPNHRAQIYTEPALLPVTRFAAVRTVSSPSWLGKPPTPAHRSVRDGFPDP